MAGFSLRIGKTSGSDLLRKALEDAAKNTGKRVGLALRRAALLAEAALKEGIVSGAPGGQTFRPLALSTTLLKGSSKPLIDKGDLLGSITTTLDNPQDPREAFVGVHRTAVANGENLFNVAMVHEYGAGPYVIQVTPAMRGFFLRLSALSGGVIKPLGSKTEILHPGIPARPFVAPVLEAIRGQIGDEVRATMGG